MALYAQGTKRQKREARACDTNEFFPGITKLEYRPEAGADDSLCFRHYNATERVHGRTMEEWLRPAVSFWHAFHATGVDSYGLATFNRSWEDAGTTNTLESHKRRLRAAFEFYTKLGVKYWTVFDRDLAPEGESLDETFQMLDEATELVIELQQRCSVRPLWFGVNLFSSPRYMNGAATNPDAQVMAYAGTQLKKAMDVAHKLGAENFLIWGAREGFQSPLTADLPREIRQYARFLKMAADYKEKIGFRGQLLLRPGPSHNCRDGAGSLVEGRYDYDVMSAMCLLKHNNLERHFKLSVAPGKEHLFAHAFSVLGGVELTSDYKRTAPYMTEPFGPDVTLLLKTILEQGGVQPGGMSLAMNIRRESTDLKDMFVVYAQGLDTLARSLKSSQRYLSYQSGFGNRLTTGEATLEECEEFTRRHGEPTSVSSHFEHWAAMFRYYN